MTSAQSAPTVQPQSPRQSVAPVTPPAPIALAVPAFIKKHPVVSYSAMAFAISWSGVLIVFGPGGLASTTWQSDPRLALMGVALLAGPSVASVLLTALLDGRAGLRELLSRLVKWRVGVRWYVVALLAPPLLAAATTLALSLTSPEFLPAIFKSQDKPSLLLSAIATGLMIGLFEELGWTGFAIPRLRLHHGVLGTGLILGVVWGAWHFMPFWQNDSFSAALPLALLLGRLFSWLPAFRVFMVFVYDRTGSLLVTMLMHASLVASTTFIFSTVPTSHMSLLIGILAWAAVLWVVVAGVAVALVGPLLRFAPPSAK